jgi:hypothetical protein
VVSGKALVLALALGVGALALEVAALLTTLFRIRSKMKMKTWTIYVVQWNILSDVSIVKFSRFKFDGWQLLNSKLVS